MKLPEFGPVGQIGPGLAHVVGINVDADLGFEKAGRTFKNLVAIAGAVKADIGCNAAEGTAAYGAQVRGLELMDARAFALGNGAKHNFAFLQKKLHRLQRRTSVEPVMGGAVVVRDRDIQKFLKLFNQHQMFDRQQFAFDTGNVLWTIAACTWQAAGKPICQGSKESFNIGTQGGLHHRTGVDAATDKFTQRIEGVFGQVCFCVVKLEYLPAGIGSFRADFADKPATTVRESKCVTSVTVKVLLCGNQSFIHQTMSGLLSHAS